MKSLETIKKRTSPLKHESIATTTKKRIDLARRILNHDESDSYPLIKDTIKDSTEVRKSLSNNTSQAIIK